MSSLFVATIGTSAVADPWITPGDVALRHDLQLLSDAGILRQPLASWPVNWGQVARDVNRMNAPASVLRASELAALTRVRARAADAAREGEWHIHGRVAAAAQPVTLRTFADTPREAGELEGGAQFTGNFLAIRLQGTLVTGPDDDQTFRADGSYVGAVLGNWMLMAGLVDRWWGPGWEGSLILSTNARPIPALSLERNFADPLESRWFSWLGPLRFVTFMGRMEGHREDVDQPLLWGLRVETKPLKSLEIGISRTAQWCGEGRPCGFDTFWDLLVGNDNRGGTGVDPDDEPGNQLAGFDVRWSLFRWVPVAVYGQGIGEDEAGSLPSKYVGLFGIETWGEAAGGSWRVHVEYSDTACDFLNTEPQFGCAYEHEVYREGYRYRGRVIGHAMDRDGRMLSLGGLFVDERGHNWSALARIVNLNRESMVDAHSISPTAADLVGIQFMHERSFGFGTVRLGLGYDAVDEATRSPLESELRGFIEWRGEL